MIDIERRNAFYNSYDLITLKKAKEKCTYLKYLEWLKDDDLGIIHFDTRTDPIFIPVTYKGDQVIEKNNEL